MKTVQTALITVFLLSLFTACKKDITEVAPTTTTISGDSLTTVYTGTFIPGDEKTSGTVTLKKTAAGNKYLFFENFLTAAGPDLHIYLSEDLGAVNYTEVSNKVYKGNSQIAVDASIDINKKRKVLIWCKTYSVLFGSAELK